MGSGDSATRNTLPDDVHPLILELRERHRLELENLTLTRQPFRTLQLFIFATLQHLKRSLLYVLMKGTRFMLLSMLVVGFSGLFMTANGSYEKHGQEFLNYFRFVLWWVALGVASSIGLGSGLHTFVLYLGPHIALFTIKAMKCGRVDLKYAPYDTIQLKRGPSWLEKDCAEFGPPLYPSSAGSLVKIPVSILLPHVQLEAVLWGIGTALGELPPYFISSAARISGNKLDAMVELDTSSKDDGFVSAFLRRLKRWFLNRSQHLNFFTILVLASVPNPLFDLAGIMCGQFGIPFWKFFSATLIGKAIIKTHIQTVFIICVCNNQLLEWVDHQLLWVLGLFPGFSYMLPNIITKLNLVKEKYLSVPVTVTSATPDIQEEKRWNVSFSVIWNSVVWLMLVNFFIKIVTATAQSYLRKQQDIELKLLESKQSNNDQDCASLKR